MGKLHETLSVIDSLQTQLKAILEEAKGTLANKEGLFKGIIVEQRSLAVSDDDKVEFPDAKEVSEVAENVPSKLQYVGNFLASFLDAEYQKDEGNRIAKADIVVDGDVLLSGVSAVTLLTLEHKLRAFRDVAASAKTYDPTRVWTPAPNTPNVFEAPPVRKALKVAREGAEIVVKESDKHPAQWRPVKIERIVATRETRELTGLISPLRKHKLLARIDAVIVAVKQARQRANEVEVPGTKIGAPLIEYLLGD